MSETQHSTKLQVKLEKNVVALVLMLALTVSVGGIVEIVPLFYLPDTVEDRMKNADGTAKFPEVVWQREAGQTLAE